MSSLDPDVWSHLPPELLERIISRLPVTTILRFRSVCRKWNLLPFDKGFFKLHSQVASSPGFFKSNICIGGDDTDVTYLEGSGKWRTLPLNFLPSHRLTLEASGGGLLLFSQEKSSCVVEAYYVCNPITKESRKLERSSVRIVKIAGIDVDQSTQEFKVVVTGWTDFQYVGCQGKGLLINVFDSRRNSWEEKGSVWEDGFSELRALVMLSGTLYLAIDSGNSLNLNLKVVAIHMEEGRREVFDGLSEWSEFHGLGEYRGNLVILGQLRNGNGMIEVWQLKKEAIKDHRWIVLDSLSKGKISPGTKVSPALPETAAVAGGLVCFFNHFAQPLALHDLREQSWCSVNVPADRMHWVDIRPCAFQPSFVPLKLIQ